MSLVSTYFGSREGAEARRVFFQRNLRNLSETFIALRAAIALLSILASPILAKADTPNDGREAASEMESEKAMAEFAKCVVRSNGREKKALAYLQIPESDPAITAAGYQIARSDCARTGAQMRFKETLFSRSLYTALYQKYYRATPPADGLNIVPADYRSEFTVTKIPVGDAQLALRAFGDCATKQNPKAVHDFVLSDLRSEAEKATVSKVVESLQQCLAPDVTLKFSRTLLKGLVAESLYKARKRDVRTVLGVGQ
jgi:hypothetical protein